MISYRAPRPDEAGALAGLARGTFVETFGHLYSQADLNSFLATARSQERYANHLANPRVEIQCAYAGEAMAGYCLINHDPGFEDFDHTGRRVIELSQLYLTAATQGAGVGPALMEWAMDRARACDAEAMVLSVWSGNERAQRFYQRFGFRWIADTYFMVGNQRDAEFLFLLDLK